MWASGARGLSARGLDTRRRAAWGPRVLSCIVWSLCCALLLGCGGRAEGNGTEPSDGADEDDGTSAPIRPVDCTGPVEQCRNRRGCEVVRSYERLDESGCLRRVTQAVGCILEGTVVSDSVTEAFGPDGACWSFLDTGIPAAFRRSRTCENQINQAPACADY